MPVFDATNHAQNILHAVRALEQINNQIQSLQNEATMLQCMTPNLERIDFPQLRVQPVSSSPISEVRKLQPTVARVATGPAAFVNCAGSRKIRWP